MHSQPLLRCSCIPHLTPEVAAFVASLRHVMRFAVTKTSRMWQLQVGVLMLALTSNFKNAAPRSPCAEYLTCRYLKYLTKRYLKRHNVRDWLRVIASNKDRSCVTKPALDWPCEASAWSICDWISANSCIHKVAQHALITHFKT